MHLFIHPYIHPVGPYLAHLSLSSTSLPGCPLSLFIFTNELMLLFAPRMPSLIYYSKTYSFTWSPSRALQMSPYSDIEQ